MQCKSLALTPVYLCYLPIYQYVKTVRPIARDYLTIPRNINPLNNFYRIFDAIPLRNQSIRKFLNNIQSVYLGVVVDLPNVLRLQENNGATNSLYFCRKEMTKNYLTTY